MKRQIDLNPLTTLKGIFIMLIVFHNTQLIQPLFTNLPGVDLISVFGGIFGNSMFFILSGFLISIGYRQRITAHSLSFQSFLVRRLNKLYPAYLCSNLASLILNIAIYGFSAINLQKIVFSILLQQGSALSDSPPYNTPTWFLSALFVCYILFFCICFYFRTPTAYSCIIAGGIIWGYFLISANLTLPFCYESTGLALMNFFIGCALAELYPRLNHRIQRSGSIISFCTLLAILLLFLRYGVEIISGNVKVGFSFLICPLILFLATSSPLFIRILNWKPLVFLGKISSHIFFWHLVLFHLFHTIFQHIMPNTAMTETYYFFYLASMLGFCVLLYHFSNKRTVTASVS